MLKWPNVPTATYDYKTSNVTIETFHLSSLARLNLLNNPVAFNRFQQDTGLADFYWEASYYQPPGCRRTLREAFEQADGFAIFLHGWNGNHRIWEDLPMRLIQQYQQVVCLNLDIHGFGQSPFIHSYPKPEHADLPAAMASVEKWLETVSLWPATYRQRKPFYLFVGHSMGGGVLFYKDQLSWQNDLYGCYMMSPSMLYHETIRRLLFQIVGAAILIPHVTPIKKLVAQLVIWVAMNEASRRVKWEHGHYQDPFETLSGTLTGIGKSSKPTRTDWSQFKLVLGNRDVLVNPKQMINFVEEFGFKPEQIRVMMGDHYFLSYDKSSPITHKYNRQTILDDLVAYCHQLANKVKGL